MPDAAEIDGRRLRSVASRDRIIDAVIALVDEDQGIPGAEAIAARAKVGLRSVFRHFGDMDGLYTAVLDKVGRRYSTIVRPYLSDNWQGQVKEAMERRVGMFEGVWPYRRVGDMYRQRSMLMQDGWNAFNLMLRGRLEGILPNNIRTDAFWFEQLDLMLSIEVYGRLRDKQRLDHNTAAAVIAASVSMLLAAKS
jgi:AcrR family transcriptional regulator